MASTTAESWQLGGGSGGKERLSCPCKKIPMSLSSFTAAEYGNVLALKSRADRSYQGSLTTLTSRQDSAGNTPLHIAAQHGHVDVVSLMLRLGTIENGECGEGAFSLVNAAAGGATPLHRASFSGATSTMWLLIEDPTCDLMAKDTSFGDRQTPLHKAASGGRYLAVQLMLEALQWRSEEKLHQSTTFPSHSTPDLLAQALTTLDAMGRTPLDVALEKQQNQSLEKSSVVRWDSVSECDADWHICAELLEQAEQTKRSNGTIPVSSFGPQLQSNLSQQRNGSPTDDIHQRTSSFPLQQCMDIDCGNNLGGDNGCLTASWERAFQSVLISAVNEQSTNSSLQALAPSRQRTINDYDGNLHEYKSTSDVREIRDEQRNEGANNDFKTSLPADDIVDMVHAPPTAENARQKGSLCHDCHIHQYVLYPRGGGSGDRVCHGCRKRWRRKQSARC